MNKTVTVVIPCRNEEAFIGKCIESFIKQSYPKELLTIAVADGMSEDNTRDIIEEYKNRYGNVLLVENEGLTAPKGMNKGIKATESDIVIIFGAHAEADKDFVIENVNALESTEVGCSGGVIRTINDSVKGEAIAQAMMCPFGVGNATFRYSTEESFVDTVGFGAYRRKELVELGMFDEELVRNQDDELNFRVIKSGKKILHSPKIKGIYYSRSSLKNLWKQYYQYGFWKVRVIQKHKRPASIRHLIPMLFSIYLILGIPLSFISEKIRWAVLSILSLYIILDLFFSARMVLKSKVKYFRYLLIVFPMLHLSYGVGFIMGFFNFYIFKSDKLENSNKKLSR
jgi:cellulose synthase/poly-beta-1,6-N-acetylglucosamine synthase-like glycosyltransferase